MRIKRLIAKAIRKMCNPPAITDSSIHKTSKVCSGSQINYSSIERYTYIGHDCFLLHAQIGSFSSIADSCRIGGANHPINRVSSSPVFHEGKNVLKKNFALFQEVIAQPIEIGSDVWIGAGVIIKSGVHIGSGAVIGAGSVVTKDVPSYEIWAGNPAKFIRKRFDEDIIDSLCRMKWWDWSDDKIARYAGCFDDPKKLIQEYSNDGETE